MKYTSVFDGTYTFGEFMRIVTGPSEMSDDDKASRTNLKSGTWDLGLGFDGSVKLAFEGWAEGVKQLQPLLADIEPGIASKMEKIEWTHDVEAAQLDVAAYLQGEPECWLVPDVKYVAGQGKLIKVVVNAAVSWNIKAEEILNKGAAVTALVQLLERAGHSVELDYVVKAGCTESREQTFCFIVHLKGFGESLNLARLGFMLMHPAAFRRLGFAFMENAFPRKARQAAGVEPNKGYGRLSFGTDLDDIKADIKIVSQRFEGMEVSKAWVIEQLKAQGITLKGESK